MPRKSRHSAALQFLHDRYFGDDSKRLASLDAERLNARIARQIYELRTRAGLSQRQLAARVRTTASVICKLEDADYRGHSLSMLRRIASALSYRIDLRFLPLAKRPRSPKTGRKTRAA